LLRQATAGQGPLVLLGGEAGVGKSALADEFCRRIGDLSLLVIVTYRDDELGSTHPLRLALGDLATAPAIQRMPLQ
jgi:predicted ATPase